MSDQTAFAAVDDVAARWRTLSESEETRCMALLDDASDLIRTTCPNWHAAGQDTLRRVCCAVVIRSMQSGDMQGVTQTSQTAGPFTQSWSYSDPAGDLYLTKQEKRSLGGTLRLGSIDMATMGGDA